MKKFKIALAKGDGIGPEVVDTALEVLKALDMDPNAARIERQTIHFSDMK